jgi:uncharacterized protein
MQLRKVTTRDVAIFFVLACVITWVCDAPLALAWQAGRAPPSYALPLVALGAFGPTLAALLVTAPKGQARTLFRPWRTELRWVLLGLALPFLLHLPATLLEVALGGHPAQWFYPPVLPEHIAALVIFSVGEEFGWRGFAYPRLADLVGPVRGALIVGSVWGLWHLGMMFTAEDGAPSPWLVLRFVAELALWSVVIAWLFERGHRSLWIALAIHAGGHLDNVNRAPMTETRLQILRFVVLAIAAALAARALVSNPVGSRATSRR